MYNNNNNNFIKSKHSYFLSFYYLLFISFAIISSEKFPSSPSSSSINIPQHKPLLESNFAINTNADALHSAVLVHRRRPTAIMEKETEGGGGGGSGKAILPPPPHPSSSSSITNKTIATRHSLKKPTLTTTTATPNWQNDKNVEKLLKTHFPPSGFNSPEFQHIYKSCALTESWGNSNNINNFMSSIHCIHCAEHLCSSYGEITLLIAIHSHPNNIQRRNLIRETWGSLRQIGHNRIVIVFFLGLLSSPSSSSSSSSTVNKDAIHAEVEQYKDLVQMNFIENYRNLTYKHMSIMQWILFNCNKPNIKYFLKSDDDTIVDVFHLMQFLPYHQPNDFLCRTINGAPMRNKAAKWYVSQQDYAPQRYPSYCEGFAYLMNAKKIRDIYWCSLFTKFFWIDDVYVSGILAEKLKLKRENLWIGHYYERLLPSFTENGKIADYLFLVARENTIFPEIYYKIWRNILRHHIN